MGRAGEGCDPNNRVVTSMRWQCPKTQAESDLPASDSSLSRIKLHIYRSPLALEYATPIIMHTFALLPETTLKPSKLIDRFSRNYLWQQSQAVNSQECE